MAAVEDVAHRKKVQGVRSTAENKRRDQQQPIPSAEGNFVVLRPALSCVDRVRRTIKSSQKAKSTSVSSQRTKASTAELQPSRRRRGSSTSGKGMLKAGGTAVAIGTGRHQYLDKCK